MARAGYDPRALGRMFETIERESKGSGDGTPQWLSSHPNPGNRSQYIASEAKQLTIANAADQSQFEPIKSVFATLPPAMSMADVARSSAPGNSASVQSVGTPGQPVPPPSSQYRSISAGQVFQAEVPDNWTNLPGKSSVRVVPQNGYGQLNGQTVFSHGIEFGIVEAQSRDLREATAVWLNAVARNNPDLRLAGEQRPLQISQRSAIGTPLVNASPLGGQERIGVYTMFLAEGVLFYYLTVVPESDAQAFVETFRRVAESIRLTAR
jgi:hypothetical protein